MATTTNYGWTTPDDTALVKDGASAIRTLGSSVDTTTKALNPETTLGDLAYRSSTANVKTRLGLGTAGQVLTVNSGATAPEWATSSSGGMTLISTTTLTGSTVTLSSIPQTYVNLFIVIQGFRPTTDENVLAMRINNDANSRYANRFLAGQGLSFNLPNFTVGSAISNSAVSSNALQTILIPDYTNTTTWKFATHQSLQVNYSTTTFDWQPNTGVYNQTGAISQLNFGVNNPYSTNNFDGSFVSGTIKLYGVK